MSLFAPNKAREKAPVPFKDNIAKAKRRKGHNREVERVFQIREYPKTKKTSAYNQTASVSTICGRVLLGKILLVICSLAVSGHLFGLYARRFGCRWPSCVPQDEVPYKSPHSRCLLAYGLSSLVEPTGLHDLLLLLPISLSA